MDWPDEPRESQASKLDEQFLSGPNSRPERRKLPFFSDLHQEISRFWKQPFSSRLTNAAAADFTNLVGSVEQGYTTIHVVEDTLASHLSPSLAPSWKSRPLLPTKPCRTTSALIGKSYIAAGQAGMALHTIAIPQAYQADVLKDMDEGTGLTPEAVKELHRATDLALRATKHTARAVGRSMAGSVDAERHFWLILTEIREKEKVLLLDAPISQSGLFGEAVSSVVEKFCSAKTQSAALKQFMPRRTRDHSTPSSSLSREQSLPRKEPSGRSGTQQAAHPPPTTVWRARGRPFPRQRPRRRVDLKRPSRPAASAIRVIPDPRVGIRRAFSPLRGETRCIATRGIALGSPHSSVQRHTSVWEESPPLRRSSADSSKQRLEGFCATTGTFLPPTERSDRGNTSVGHRTRVLQPLLPCSKKGRRPETHSGSAASELFSLQREVQDADDEIDHVSDSRRGLVCLYRPKGCILSHPGRPATQEVPSVCLWREGLPIQGPSLRPGLGTENVHKVHGCCTGPLEVPGHSCSELLRRLAHSGPLQGVSESSQRYRSPPHSFSWPQNEHQEECSLPLTANRVFGGSLRFCSDAGPFGSCPDTQGAVSYTYRVIYI